MAQAIKVVCLNEEQVETTLKNMCFLRGLNSPKKIFSGKPKYTQELCEKYNIPFITKFAEKYSCYLAEDKEKNNEGFIVIYSDKVDMWNISASAALYYEYFHGKINPESVPPKMTILPAFTVSENLTSHYKENIILDCNYRIFSLIEIYPLIGNKNNDLFKLSYNYKIHHNSSDNNFSSYYGKEYPKIYDNDPIVKILNGIPHDIITCNALAYDDSVFSQTYIREIIPSERLFNKISLSGICLHKL